MLFALHPAECYYNTAIFNSTLREERQYICHLTNTPKPLYVLSLMLCITVDAEGSRRIMPRRIIQHHERRCAPFVWTQAFSSPSSHSFALPPARADLCPPIQMQELPPQHAGKQQVHTYPWYSSTEGLQVRVEKQLQKYGRLAAPKAAPPLRTEPRLSSLAQLITIPLCPSDPLLSPSGVIPCLSLFLPSSQVIFLSHSHVWILPLSARSHHLAWFLPALTTDELFP